MVCCLRRGDSAGLVVGGGGGVRLISPLAVPRPRLRVGLQQSDDEDDEEDEEEEDEVRIKTAGTHNAREKKEWNTEVEGRNKKRIQQKKKKSRKARWRVILMPHLPLPLSYVRVEEMEEVVYT